MNFHITRRESSDSSIDWIIPDMVLMNHVNLIDGRGESGKSSIVSAIIGKWNSSDFELSKGLKNVLWLSQEEPFDLVVKPRLLQYGLDGEQVITIPYRNGDCPKPILPHNIDPFVGLLARHNVNCLVIDPFSELKPNDWNVNDGDAMRQYMTTLAKICGVCKTTIFCMRHMRKSSGSYSADDGMGSMQIAATARNVLRVDRTEERTRRYFITVQKSNMAKPTMPMEFGFDLLPGHFGKVRMMGHKDLTIDEIKKMSESKVRRMKMDEAKSLLLEALKDGPQPCTALLEEADDNGIGKRTLEEAKAELDIWSHRTRDESTQKFYSMWGLKVHPKPKREKGDEMPQLTLEDLPVSETVAPVTNDPVTKKIIDDFNADHDTPKKSEPAKKPAKPKATKKPKKEPTAK